MMATCCFFDGPARQKTITLDRIVGLLLKGMLTVSIFYSPIKMIWFVFGSLAHQFNRITSLLMPIDGSLFSNVHFHFIPCHAKEFLLDTNRSHYKIDILRKSLFICTLFTGFKTYLSYFNITRIYGHLRWPFFSPFGYGGYQSYSG